MADASMIAQYFNDVINELALKEACPNISTAPVNLVNGTSVYAFPAYAVLIRALCFAGTDADGNVYSQWDHLLGEASIEDIEAYSSAWRTAANNVPDFYTMEDQNPRYYKIHPTPSSATPWTLLAIYNSNEVNAGVTTIPYWLVFPIFHEIIRREFARPSDHQDIDYASALEQLVKIFNEIARI
jgi:hypothetical protein